MKVPFKFQTWAVFTPLRRLPRQAQTFEEFSDPVECLHEIPRRGRTFSIHNMPATHFREFDACSCRETQAAFHDPYVQHQVSSYCATLLVVDAIDLWHTPLVVLMHEVAPRQKLELLGPRARHRQLTLFLLSFISAAPPYSTSSSDAAPMTARQPPFLAPSAEAPSWRRDLFTLSMWPIRR